jgi:hypothetical protein
MSMRSKSVSGSMALIALAALSACSGSKGGVMARGGGPDEFMVSKRAPLTIPPDFVLTPPKPGAPRPQEADSSQQALSAMFGGPAPRSTTEKDIIGMTKTTPEPGIRSEAGDVATATVDKGPATRTILAANAANSDIASITTGN